MSQPLATTAPIHLQAHTPIALPAAQVRGHIPALDGVRGLAIVLVMLHHLTILKGSTVVDHAWHTVWRFGFIGVDLFFVLSGFLITGILFDSKGSDGFFRNFYARRTLRIFPLYYATLVLFLVIIPATGLKAIDRFGSLDGQSWWYWLYLSNFHGAVNNRFMHGALGVTWSLAIEEQFYLIWPTVVFFLGRRGLIRACVAMMVIALACRTAFMLAGNRYDMWAYAATFCRMDSLAVGALIALVARGEAGFARLLSSARWVLPAAAATLLIMWTAESRSLAPVESSVLAIAFGALLVLAIHSPPTTVLGGVCNSWIMILFGKYSYALYLFHYPIMVLMRAYILRPGENGGPAPLLKWPALFGSGIPGQLVFYAVGVVLSTAVALLSWHLFEKHFLKLKHYFPSGKR